MTATSCGASAPHEVTFVGDALGRWSLIDIAIAAMMIYGLSAHFGDRGFTISPEKAHQHVQGGSAPPAAP